MSLAYIRNCRVNFSSYFLLPPLVGCTDALSSFRFVCGRLFVCLFVGRCYFVPPWCVRGQNAFAVRRAAFVVTGGQLPHTAACLSINSGNKSYLRTHAPHTCRTHSACRDGRPCPSHNHSLPGALLMTECILIQKQFVNSRKMECKIYRGP